MLYSPVMPNINNIWKIKGRRRRKSRSSWNRKNKEEKEKEENDKIKEEITMLKAKMKVADALIEDSQKQFIELGKRKHVNQSKFTEVTSKLSVGVESRKDCQAQLEVLEKKVKKT